MGTAEEEIRVMKFTGDMEDAFEHLLEEIRREGPSPELLQAIEVGLIKTVVPRHLPSDESVYANLTAESLRSVLVMRDRQLSYLRTQWVRDAKLALAGDPRWLANRIAMYEEPPVEIVQS